MCRLTAYSGPAIPLENIIVKPGHSLLVQSQDANEAKLAVNGDGFGIAWYGNQPEPGLYKDVFPAWSDSNLPSICRMVSSSLFLAHVRASTVGAVSRENCHPFTHARWSFMHNGVIGDFKTIRRKMENLLADEYYATRHGGTDSELFFLLMLTNGLDQNPQTALAKTIGQINELVIATDLNKHPVRLTCVFSNGHTTWGFRHASDDKSPSLYLSRCLDHGGRALASEPLHGDDEHWREVEPGQLVSMTRTGVETVPLL
jgi:glutamine amidotransferase